MSTINPFNNQVLAANVTFNGGTMSIGTDNVDNTINIATVANAGRTLNLGSTTGTSGIVERVGTGNYSLDGAAASTYAIGASTTTGTVTIGGTAQTGTMTLGSSSGTNTLVIGGGSGATTVQIANAQNGGSVAIGAGMTTGTIAIGGTGAQTGTITFGGGTGAQTVNIGTGGTGVKTIHIGDSAVANVITLGSTTGAASTTIQSGSGNIAMNAGFTVDSTGRNKNTVQPAFAAYLANSTGNNVTGDGTAFTILFDTKLFDQGTNYATGTGLFTAPVTGKYFFQAAVFAQNLAAGHTALNIKIVTTAASFFGPDFNPAPINIGGAIVVTTSVFCTMTANDTASIVLTVSNSTKTVGVAGQALGSGAITYFNGYLVC